MSETILDFLKTHSSFTVILKDDILEVITKTCKMEVSLKDNEGYTIDELIANSLEAIQSKIISG